MPAPGAGSVLFIAEVAVEDRSELLFNIHQLEKLLVEFVVASFAEPHEAVQLARATLTLDDEPDRVRGPLRRVRDAGGEQKHVSFPDDDVPDGAVLEDAEHQVTLDLVEKLRPVLDVEIRSRVGSAHHHADEFAVLPDHLVPDRRLEQVAVFLDPGGEIDRWDQLRHLEAGLRSRRGRARGGRE